MTITQSIIIGSAIILVLYDVLALGIWGKTATISVVTYSWARRYPVIAFALGFVMGHIFWPVI